MSQFFPAYCGIRVRLYPNSVKVLKFKKENFIKYFILQNIFFFIYILFFKCLKFPRNSLKFLSKSIHYVTRYDLNYFIYIWYVLPYIHLLMLSLTRTRYNIHYIFNDSQKIYESEGKEEGKEEAMQISIY